MIYAILTLLGILALGGLTYYAMYIVFTGVWDNCYVAFGPSFNNNYTNFAWNFMDLLPILIVIIAVISALVIELRRKNPDAFF